jgi:hypothetical protein
MQFPHPTICTVLARPLPPPPPPPSPLPHPPSPTPDEPPQVAAQQVNSAKPPQGLFTRARNGVASGTEGHPLRPYGLEILKWPGLLGS